ncbi:MAG: tape measure protein [Moraxella sp.]|nr:tape measure protein [Moraxella sp.]
MANNNLHTQLTISAGVEGINDVRRLADAIEEAGGNVDGLRTSADSLQRSWGSLSTTEQTRQINALAGEAERLRQITSARMTLGLDVDDRARQQLVQVREAYQQLRQSGTLTRTELARATQLYNERVQQLNQSLGNTPLQLNNITKGLGGLMGMLGVGVGVKEIIQMADEFNNLEARVRLATEAGGDFNHAMASLRDIADSTTMPLTATADLFGKLTQSTKELGYSQKDVLGLTATISQAMAVSGGDMASMQAGLTQLGQAFASGVLRGDEFNSVVEQTPRLAQAMTDGLGVSIDGLRQMAGEGKLTAEVVGNALKSQADKIAYEYSQMPNTVSGSLTVLKNSLMGFIGEMDNELNGSTALADFITDIANGIKNIDPAIMEQLKVSLVSIGEVAKTLYESIAIIPDALGDVVGAMMGLEAGAGSVSILQGLMTGVSLATSAVADGFKALQIIIQGVVANVKTDIANLARAVHSLTGFGGEFAKSMTDSAKKSQEAFDELVMGFESSLGKAIDSISTTTEERLQQTADLARAKYDEMVQSGQASATALENAFKDYAHKAIEANNGVVDSMLEQELAQQGLQATTDQTGKAIISAMQGVKQAVDEVDLSKHAESFKALGLDVGEFAGGLSTKANTALSAFNDLAGVAGDNVGQLAMAYNGAREVIGDNADGIRQLDIALLEATGSNKELATAVLATANAQRHAKQATTEQQKALDALGVSMSAVNAGMSTSGQKMAQNLSVGLSAIKDTAKGADELKVALNQALDTALASAKTQADFKAIQTEISSAGLTAQVSAQHMAKIQAGMSQSTAHATASTKDNTTATHANTKAHADNAKVKQSQSQANKELVQSTNEVSSSLATANKNASIQGVGLSGLGIETEKLTKIFDNFYATLSNVARGGTSRYLQAFGEMMGRQALARQEMMALKDEISKMGESLDSASISTDKLTDAQKLFKKASDFSIAGVKAMDNATLKNLQGQIDKASEKIKALSDTARQTVLDLESELASIQGNEAEVLRIKHAQKLADLEAKIAQARTQGNADAIASYEKALNLQRQINEAEHKNLKDKQNQSTTLNLNVGKGGATSGNLGAGDVVKAWEQSLYDAKQEAKQELIKEMIDASKTRAR